MPSKAEEAAFLRQAGWETANRVDFPGDFSSRRYARLTRADAEQAILMIAEPDQKTNAFVHLAHVLRRIGLPTPQLYASDSLHDLVLMEDFGDKNLGHALDAGQAPEPFDQEIVRMLAHLHSRFDETMLPAVRLPLFNVALFVEQTTLFLDHYFSYAKKRMPTVRERSDFVEAWHDALRPVDALPRSLLLRDFMADNAMILNKPIEGFNVGILDFQDAGIGPIVYDLASWCEEVRRDGGFVRLENVIKAYSRLRPVCGEAELMNGARLLAAQRHTRILGVLVKLNKKDYLPRVQRMLRLLLQDKALASVARWFKATGLLS